MKKSNKKLRIAHQSTTEPLFDYCNSGIKTPNTFFVLSNSPDNPQLILTKEAFDWIKSTAKDLITKAYIQFLWETGARASEAESFSLNTLNGNKITIKNLKSRGRKETKTMLISDELIVLLKTVNSQLPTNRERFFKYTHQTWNSKLKQFHADLSNKMFRSGLATYMVNMGANKEDIQARLGHSDLRCLPYYTKEQSVESDAFMDKVFKGIDTRKVNSLSVEEYKQITREIMIQVLTEHR